MQMIVNGKSESCADNMPLVEFLTGRGHALTAVVVERNGQIVPAADFAATTLAPNDNLEIVHFVGGG